MLFLYNKVNMEIINLTIEKAEIIWNLSTIFSFMVDITNLTNDDQK